MRFLTKLICAVLLLATTAAATAGEPYGAIGDKYGRMGARNSPLGPPIGDESNADFGGRFHYFRNGSIYWHPTIGEAFAVYGAIAVKFHEAGRVNYGYPITDELATPDGRGRFNHFRAVHLPGRPEASIYWTPQTGAQAVYGAIRDTWARGGWERGPLGYPTSDEFQDGPYRRSNFERGYIVWTAQQGTRVVMSGSLIPPRDNTFATFLVRGMEAAVNGNVVGGDANFLSENAMCANYLRDRPQLTETVKNRIRDQANAGRDSFLVRSDARVGLSETCSFRAEIVAACANAVTLRMIIPGNIFKFHVTTPDGIPGGLDPEFSMRFDMELLTRILLPANSTERVRLEPQNVRVTNVTPGAENITGSFAMTMARVVQAVSGADFTAMLRRERTFELNSVVNLPFEAVNRGVAALPSNYRIESCLVPGDIVRINGTDQPDRPPIVR